MIRRLGARYPVMDHALRVLGASYLEGGYDPAYSGNIDIPGHTLGFHVSLLGPYRGASTAGRRALSAVYEAKYKEEQARRTGAPALPADAIAPDGLRGTAGLPDLPGTIFDAPPRNDLSN